MNWADVTDLKILLVVIWALGNCFWKLKEKKQLIILGQIN